MRLAWCHRWDLTPRQAIRLQQQARGRVVLLGDPAPALTLPARVVAVDVGYDRATDRCAAALIVWDTERDCLVDERARLQSATFPYVPGLLSFREIPPLLPLFRALPEPPALVVCDGQGYAHPRRVGLASHLGVVLGCPTLGWAKSRLIGEYREPGLHAGAAAPLLDGDEQVGWAFRSRAGCRLTFVSPGHLLSMRQSLQAARALLGCYRLCDPARQAHALTRRLLAQHAEQA
jgi:deoxyribonuclease V